MLLLVKFKNAAELLWDSLDAQEKAILAYLAASLLVSVYGRAAKANRERIKAELIEEVMARGR